MKVLFEIIYKIAKYLQCPDIIICNSSYRKCEELRRRAHSFVSCAVIRHLATSCQSAIYNGNIASDAAASMKHNRQPVPPGQGPVFCSSPAAGSDFMPRAQSFPGEPSAPQTLSLFGRGSSLLITTTVYGCILVSAVLCSIKSPQTLN